MRNSKGNKALGNVYTRLLIYNCNSLPYPSLPLSSTSPSLNYSTNMCTQFHSPTSFFSPFSQIKQFLTLTATNTHTVQTYTHTHYKTHTIYIYIYIIIYIYIYIYNYSTHTIHCTHWHNSLEIFCLTFIYSCRHLTLVQIFVYTLIEHGNV